MIYHTQEIKMKSVKCEIAEEKKAVSSYFRETTVHGFRYVAEGENLCEKLFWIILIIVGFIISSCIIGMSFHDWQEPQLKTTIHKVSLKIEALRQHAITV